MKVFVEEQRFKKWILLAVMVIPIASGIIPLILGENNIPTFESEGFWGLTITITVILLVLILMLSIRLRTKINEQGVYYQFFPNHFNEKFVSWYDIDKCYLKKLTSYKKYGRYGYKRCFFGSNKGITMNLGGDYGIQLELENGKNIFIGTKKHLEVERILATYKPKINNK